MSYESLLADEILKHHGDSIRGQTLAGLSDEDMTVVGSLAKELSKRKDGCRIVGLILEAIWCRETHRRGSGGRVEIASFEIGDYLPADLMNANSVAVALTYGSFSQPVGILLDEIAGQLQNQINACLLTMHRHIEKQTTRGE